MTKTNLLLCATMTLFLTACSSTKNTTSSTVPTLVQRVPAKFDFSPPSRVLAGSAALTIAMVKPSYVGKNPEYFVNPFNEMAERMANDFDELLTAKGFTIRGPFGSRDEMTYNDKINSSFILEIGIELNPQYNRKYVTTEHSPSFTQLLLDKNAQTTYTRKMSGQVTLGGNLVVKAKSAQYGELLWTKSIALDPSSFDCPGQIAWTGVPQMNEELNKDNLVYNTLSTELEKIYLRALDLAWKQIDPAEMKTVAEQGKKSDKRGGQKKGIYTEAFPVSESAGLGGSQNVYHFFFVKTFDKSELIENVIEEKK